MVLSVSWYMFTPRGFQHGKCCTNGATDFQCPLTDGWNACQHLIGDQDVLRKDVGKVFASITVLNGNSGHGLWNSNLCTHPVKV